MAETPIAFDLLKVLSVLMVGWLGGVLSERVGYPALMGEILAGFVFGPGILGLLGPGGAIEVFAELGIFLLMLYVGMEVDLDELFRLGPAALLVAFGGFVLPFVLGYGAGRWLGVDVAGSLFIGLAMAATSLATKSRILVDLDILDTRIAGVLLGVALLSDVAVLVTFGGVLGFVEAGALDLAAMGLILGKAAAFFTVTLLFGYLAMPPLWRGVERLRERYGFVDRTSAFTIAIVVALAFAFAAHAVGLHQIIGGFVAGLFLRKIEFSETLYENIYTVVHTMAMGFFAPIFFVTVGFGLTLGIFVEAPDLLALLVVVAFVGKIVGSWLSALPTRLSSREGFVIGLGMNGRGTVEIIIASIALAAGIIGPQLFSILVFLALFTTALVPPTMKWGVDWLRGHDELVQGGPEASGT